MSNDANSNGLYIATEKGETCVICHEAIFPGQTFCCAGDEYAHASCAEAVAEQGIDDSDLMGL